MSSAVLAAPAEEVCPIEVGVAGLDRLAGVSSDTTNPLLWSHREVACRMGAQAEQ